MENRSAAYKVTVIGLTKRPVRRGIGRRLATGLHARDRAAARHADYSRRLRPARAGDQSQGRQLDFGTGREHSPHRFGVHRSLRTRGDRFARRATSDDALAFRSRCGEALPATASKAERAFRAGWKILHCRRRDRWNRSRARTDRGRFRRENRARGGARDGCLPEALGWSGAIFRAVAISGGGERSLRSNSSPG